MGLGTERTPAGSGCAPSRAKIKNLEGKLSRDAPKARHGIGQCLEWERYPRPLVWFDRSTSCQRPAQAKFPTDTRPFRRTERLLVSFVLRPLAMQGESRRKKSFFRGRAARQRRTGVLSHLLSSPRCQVAEADATSAPGFVLRS